MSPKRRKGRDTRPEEGTPASDRPASERKGDAIPPGEPPSPSAKAPGQRRTAHRVVVEFALVALPVRPVHGPMLARLLGLGGRGGGNKRKNKRRHSSKPNKHRRRQGAGERGRPRGPTLESHVLHSCWLVPVAPERPVLSIPLFFRESFQLKNHARQAGKGGERGKGGTVGLGVA